MPESRQHSFRLCLSCGYDLSAAPVPTCPECGTAFDPAILPGPRTSLPPRTIALRLATLLPALYAISLLSISANSPQLHSPFPLFTSLLCLFEIAPPLSALGPTIIGATFLASLIPGRTRIPVWSRAIAALLLACDLIWVSFTARASLVYWGPTFTYAMLLLPCAVAAAAIWVALQNRKIPTFKTHVAFVVTITLWAAWGAFPWMGEAP